MTLVKIAVHLTAFMQMYTLAKCFKYTFKYVLYLIYNTNIHIKADTLKLNLYMHIHIYIYIYINVSTTLCVSLHASGCMCSDLCL